MERNSGCFENLDKFHNGDLFNVCTNFNSRIYFYYIRNRTRNLALMLSVIILYYEVLISFY